MWHQCLFTKPEIEPSPPASLPLVGDMDGRPRRPPPLPPTSPFACAVTGAGHRKSGRLASMVAAVRNLSLSFLSPGRCDRLGRWRSGGACGTGGPGMTESGAKRDGGAPWRGGGRQASSGAAAASRLGVASPWGRCAAPNGERKGGGAASSPAAWRWHRSRDPAVWGVGRCVETTAAGSRTTTG
jgi:hypothetical protein